MKPLFIANWKMNKLSSEAEAFAREFSSLVNTEDFLDTGIAPPLSCLNILQASLSGNSGLMLGAQNVHWLNAGAHTGEISAEMLKDAGVSFAIVGHSERRQHYGETDGDIAKRAIACLDAGLKAIVCVGESQNQFEAGETKTVVAAQLAESLAKVPAENTGRLIIAYEPVWAIGTGLAATPEIAQDVHSLIRSELSKIFSETIGQSIPILYGGSTKPDNIAELVTQPDVNGALIGGASLEAKSFAELIKNGRAAAG